MVYLVSYDLAGGGAPRPALRRALARCGEGRHVLPGTSLIAAACSEDDLLEAARPYLTRGDRLLIVPVSRPFTGALPQRAWRWIEARVD